MRYTFIFTQIEYGDIGMNKAQLVIITIFCFISNSCYVLNSMNFVMDSGEEEYSKDKLMESVDYLEEKNIVCNESKIEFIRKCSRDISISIRFCLPFDANLVSRVFDITENNSFENLYCCIYGPEYWIEPPFPQCEQLECDDGNYIEGIRISTWTEFYEIWWETLCELSMIEDINSIIVYECLE